MKRRHNVLAGDLPMSDPRVKLIMAKMKKEGFRPDCLIEVLHTAQGAYGYLPLNVLKFITKQLRLPPSRVYSTVTFYHFFSLKPKGDHTCVICTGTACYVKGAQAVIDEIEKTFTVKIGQVTPDNKLGLQTARCIGACGLAPAVVVDEEVIPRAKPEDVVNMLRQRTGAAQ